MIISEKKHQKITSPEDVAKILQAILSAEDEGDRAKEHFWAIGLSSNNTINYIELVTLGLLNQTLAHPREIYRTAILKSCASIIVAHNHPSGKLEFSLADRVTTKNLTKAGEILDIKLLDHILITETEFLSAKEEK